MNVKILSDGTPLNTKVLNQDGKEIPLIKRLTFDLTANEIATVNIELYEPIIEVKNIEATFYDIYLPNELTKVQLEHFKKCIENRLKELN